MKSLEARVAALEQDGAPVSEPFRRDLSDVDRAVRIVHILTRPESPQRAGLVDLLTKQVEAMPVPAPIPPEPSPVPPAAEPEPTPSSPAMPWRD